MTDLIHLGLLIVALSLLGIGLWMVTPAAMYVGLGAILLAIVWMARRTVKEQRHVRADHEGK